MFDLLVSQSTAQNPVLPHELYIANTAYDNYREFILLNDIKKSRNTVNSEQI